MCFTLYFSFQFTPAVADWDTCATKCVVPVAPDGYKNQTAWDPVTPGTVLTYECSDPLATVGPDRLPNYEVTCGADGTIPVRILNATVLL